MGLTYSKCRYWWRMQDMTMRLIVVNVAVFLALHIVGVVMLFTNGTVDTIVGWLAMPSSPAKLALRPWTPITYMFTHYDTLHALFNMLWLYWFGQIFLFSCSSRQLLGLYLYGGLGGAILFFAAALVVPAVGGSLIGASAAVMAIVIATAVINPDHPVGIFLIGELKLKWLALVTLAIYCFGLFGSNAGGEVAHIGGALVGAWFGLARRRGTDITRPFRRLVDALCGSGSRPHAKRPRSLSPEAELDILLDKIRKSGYASLSPSERNRLFELSRRQ